MKVRYATRQILQHVPGFAGWIHRRGLAREVEALRMQAGQQAREVDSLRDQVALQGTDAALLRTEARERDDEIKSLRTQAEEQVAGAALLRTEAQERGNEIESLRARADQQGNETESLRARADEQGNEIADLRAKADAQAGAITSVIDRLAAMQAEAETREVARAAANHLQWKDVPHLEKQGLFIVGHARSGTTVLMLALNTCPDIHLLGEANIHSEGTKTGFPRWFNEMHRQFGNTSGKGTYCPVAPDEEANGIEVLEWLSRRFRYVGEKVAFRSETLGYDPDGFFEFQARHFLLSHYLCIIRNPADVLKSNSEMFSPDDLSVYADSYLRALQLVLEISDTFPNVFVLFHERIDQGTFDVIGEKLDVDLQHAFAIFEKRYQGEGRWGRGNAHLPAIEILVEAHRLIRDAFSPDTLRAVPDAQPQMLGRRLRAMRQEAAALAASPRMARQSAS